MVLGEVVLLQKREKKFHESFFASLRSINVLLMEAPIFLRTMLFGKEKTQKMMFFLFLRTHKFASHEGTDLLLRSTPVILWKGKNREYFCAYFCASTRSINLHLTNTRICASSKGKNGEENHASGSGFS